MISHLYFHIPYCHNICPYCNFYVISSKYGNFNNYLEAIINELILYSKIYKGNELNTCFIGGGTPSVLGADKLESFLTKLNQIFSFKSLIEFTIEVNPSSINQEKLVVLKNNKVDRISMGVQSFNNKVLSILGRDHSVEIVFRKFEILRENGFNNINLDLMFAVPNQNMATWKVSLKKAVDLDPEHISLYGLTIEKGTRFHTLTRDGKLPKVSEDTYGDMYLYAIDYLESTGFLQYEVSNFAKTGFESKHNFSYWNGSSYLGIGTSSHSYVQGERWWNHKKITKYINSISTGELPIENFEKLNKSQLRHEDIFLGLRTINGLYVPKLDIRYGGNFLKDHEQILEKMIENGMIKLNNSNINLTPRGFLLIDSIVSEFI